MNERHNRFCEKFECPYYLSSKSKFRYLENNSISDKMKIGQTKRSWFDPTWCNIFWVENLGLGLGRQGLVIMHPCPCFFYFTYYVGQRNRPKWFPYDKIIEIISQLIGVMTAILERVWDCECNLVHYCRVLSVLSRRLLIGWWLDAHIYIHMVLVTPHTQLIISDTWYIVYPIFLYFWGQPGSFYKMI